MQLLLLIVFVFTHTVESEPAWPLGVKGHSSFNDIPIH